MRNVSVLFVLATLAGCGSSSPAVPAAPVMAPVQVVAPPPPPPPAQPVEPVRVEAAPIVPPVAPRLRVAQRSIFELDRVALWTLENGLTVLYAWEENAPEYLLHLSEVNQPGGVCLIHDLYGEVDKRSVLVADGIEDAVRSARARVETLGLTIPETTVTLYGAIHPEWVEAEVATTLGAVRPTVAGVSVEPRAPAQARIDVDWDDLAALTIVAAVLADRLAPSDTVQLTYDAADGSLVLRVESLALPVRQWLAPSAEGAVRDARTRASRAVEEPAVSTVLFHQLTRLPGRFQPARPPSDVRGLSSRIQRTPPDRVNALLARLASALTP